MDYFIMNDYALLHEESVIFEDARTEPKPGGFASSITFLTDEQRRVFFLVFLLILGVAVFGNVTAIYAMKTRKCRFLQKACIVSLAVSDLTMAIAYGINNIETFSHPQVNWTLGRFMCSFIPFLQMLGITASTSAMVIIALDRYRNVVHAMSYRWNPKPNACITGFLVMWIICIGVSAPICGMFEIKLSYIIFQLEPTPHVEPMQFCVSLVKQTLMMYYACMASAIFSTLFLIFIWLYYHIAKLVWTHRRPPQTPTNRNETSTTNETSIGSDLKPSYQKPKPQLSKANNVHVERKIRTFKIIICLMLVFFICRIPFWAYNILKLVTNNYNEPKHWVLTYIFNGLALLNCALNPFLYTFLNQTLLTISKIHRTVANFTCDVCCCCFTGSDFDEFQRENPFVVENFDKVGDGPKLGESPKIPKVRLRDGQVFDRAYKY